MTPELISLQDLRDPLEQISDSHKQEEKAAKAPQSNTDRSESTQKNARKKGLKKSLINLKRFSLENAY